MELARGGGFPFRHDEYGFSHHPIRDLGRGSEPGMALTQAAIGIGIAPASRGRRSRFARRK